MPITPEPDSLVEGEAAVFSARTPASSVQYPAASDAPMSASRSASADAATSGATPPT